MEYVDIKNIIEKINSEITYQEYTIEFDNKILKCSSKDAERYINFLNKKFNKNIVRDEDLIDKLNKALLEYNYNYAENIVMEVDEDSKDEKKNNNIDINIDIESLLYINYKGEDKTILYLYSFRGFTRGFLDNFKRNPSDSFFKFVLDKFLKESPIEGNVEDYLTTKTREYIDCITEKISSKGGEKEVCCKPNKSNLFDEINYISTLTYEGINVFSKLAIMTEEARKKFVDFYIELDTPIKFDEYRKIRKLLETANNEIYLIGDKDQAYGLGKFKEYESIHTDKQSIYIFEFIGKFEYNINNILIEKSKIIDEKSEKKELTGWTLKESSIINITYGKPSLRERIYSEVTLGQTIDIAFKDVFKDDNKDKIENIKNIVKYAKRQKHGTTVVIAQPNIAKEETELFKSQSIKIKEKRLNLNDQNLEVIINRITNIDGAIYIDTECFCHAIGVILDGIAEAGYGDSSRGARYNSAIKYSLKEKVKGKCIVVVISEDGMVNVIYEGRDYKEHVIAIKKKRAEELFRGAKDLFTTKDYDGALEKLNESISKYDKNDEALNLRGRIRGRKECYKEAIEDYDKAIELNSNEPSYYNNKGVALNNMKDYYQAIECYEKAISLDGKNPAYYNNKGNAFYNINQYEEAIECYNEGIKLNSCSANYYNNKGNALYNLGKDEESIECFNEAIKLNPKEASYYNAKGNSLYSLEKYKEAIECYNESIRLDANEAIYRNNKGNAFYNLDQYEEALKCYEKSIELSKDNAKYYNDKGDALYNLKKYKEALECYDKAIELDPKEKDYRDNRDAAVEELKKNETKEDEENQEDSEDEK